MIKSRNTLQREMVCHSMETIPLHKRQKRYFNENCVRNDQNNGHNNPVKEDRPTQLLDKQSDFHMLSTCNDTSTHLSAEAENKALKVQLQHANAEIERIRAEYKNLKRTLDDLAVDRPMDCTESPEKIQDILKRYFTEGQIQCILQGKKGVRWSVDDYAAAILLHSTISTNAYLYLQQKLNYPLPSLFVLRRWALNKFNIQEGFLTDVLKLMREKAKDLSSLYKVAVLTFVEMAISEVQLDLKLEKIVGPYSKVQVIMVRALFGNWKQPIFYKYDSTMTKDILIEAVMHLHGAGYHVVAYG